MKIRRILFRFCTVLSALFCFCNASVANPQTTSNSGIFTPGYGFRDCPECPGMVVIPAGHFVLNTADSPQTIAIEQSFAIGKYEVTFEEWDAC
ncbi:MAG TPA: SUMF1/EgtB/PvdO family nonheme iron enzyme, partial [Azonexus sp.]|nr:SUMF1/EgtB/PvdO family nonheme iron enzyme [Azonexus sp.]